MYGRYVNYEPALPEGEVDLVITDDLEDEVTYLGTIRDYAVAQEIIKRWNEYKG